MSLNSFFKSISKEMQGNPYQERFLEELTDHAEDLGGGQVSKEWSDEDLEKHFGKPKDIKTTFIHITRPWQTLLEVLEALGYGFLAVMMVYMSLSISPAFAIIGRLTMLLEWGLMLIIPLLFYRWAWRHRYRSRKIKLIRQKIWKGLTLVPNAVLILSLIPLSVSLAGPTFNLFLIVHSLLFLSSGFMLFKSKDQVPNRQKKRSANPSFWVKIIGFLFFIYITSVSILRTFFYPELMDLIEKTGSLFTPFLGAEFFALQILPMMIARRAIFLSAYISIGFLLMLIVSSLFVMIRNRRWSWWFGAIIVYVLGIFFVSPQPVSYSFKIPAANLSHQIESTQFGPFQGWLNRFYEGMDVDEAFHYDVTFEDDRFILSQRTDKDRGWYFSFDPSQSDMDDLSFSKQRHQFADPPHKPYMFWEDQEAMLAVVSDMVDQWPKEIECDSSNEGKSIEPEYIYPVVSPGEAPAEPMVVMPEERGPLAPNQCYSLAFKGRIIFGTLDHAPSIKNMAISDDQNWLVIIFGGHNGPDQPYLLDLRDI